MENKFVTLIFPLALPKLYTYTVPEDLQNLIEVGMRVEASLKNKIYSAIVAEISDQADIEYRPKPIISLIDSQPIISSIQLLFWRWMADYYCATVGEVMHVALPAGMKLASETKIILNSAFEEDFSDLSDDEYLIAEALSIQNQLTIDQIQGILNKKTIYPVIRSLLERKIIFVHEELIQKFKPKKLTYVELTDTYNQNRNALTEVLESVKSEKQTKAILAFIQLSGINRKEMTAASIYDLANVDSSVLNALVKKDVFRLVKKEVSRLYNQPADTIIEMPELSVSQQSALSEINAVFSQKKPVLLHGVTGSGKTHVYKELIKDVISSGKQVLYLLPEIALTTQTVDRLRSVFGADVLVYHSRMSDNERVEIWNAVHQGHKILLGARSSLLLPFKALGLIIVDEEHDPSYKQNDPNPRYNARDAAIYLAGLSSASIILGSATPSLESYLNARSGKYGLIELSERHGDSDLPDIHIIDLRKEQKDKRFDGLISIELKTAITKALSNKEQVIIFQNRRGYAPTLNCNVCGWKAECINCDVFLTVHKFHHELRCHYCGTRSRYPEKCPACGNDDLTESGFGTEKIEEIFAAVFPDAKVKRLDLDTAKTKLSFEKILYEFEQREIDILVGTQMITKGLDFDHIAVVGVLNADALMRYPDLRANERAFQLLTQVAGRAGRREKKGKVYIQTYNPEHPVLLETMSNHYQRFLQRESAERKRFRYPPYYRMIQIELLHRQAQVVEHSAQVFAEMIKAVIGDRLLGPAVPSVGRLRGMYIRQITIKIEKDPKVVQRIKAVILEARTKLKQVPACKSVRINIDVDPY
ncbi:MAG: primosomal protein N' [Saprospiraceae bacterium]|nr:primosomal protein N' [Saprospiraceae bacterium]